MTKYLYKYSIELFIIGKNIHRYKLVLILRNNYNTIDFCCDNNVPNSDSEELNAVIRKTCVFTDIKPNVHGANRILWCSVRVHENYTLGDCVRPVTVDSDKSGTKSNFSD